MKSLKMLMITALTILSVSVFAQDTIAQKIAKHETEKAKYVCPMHPDMVMDEPGKCTKCGTELNLSPKEKMKMDVMKIYTCPVHADVTSDKPGECPQCKSKMNLTPKEKMKMDVMKIYIYPTYLG